MLKLINLLPVSVTLFLGWANLVVAASFDCDQATTETEIAICNDPELSALDNLMGIWWKTDRKPVGDKEIPTIESQRHWIRLRDTCVSNRICILTHYKSRLKEFGFGTVAIFDHANRKPEYFLSTNILYAYQSSGFLYRSPNAERTGLLLKLENPKILVPNLYFLERISSCDSASITANILFDEITFTDVLGANLWNEGEIMEEIATYAKWAGHGDQSTSVHYRLLNSRFIPYKISFDSCLDNAIEHVEVLFEQQ